MMTGLLPSRFKTKKRKPTGIFLFIGENNNFKIRMQSCSLCTCCSKTMSKNNNDGIPTRVRKTTVRTTPVRRQQCECQQCERVNSANANGANATAVRKTILRTVQNLSVSLFFFLQKLLLLFNSIFYLKMPIAARFSIYQEM